MCEDRGLPTLRGERKREQGEGGDRAHPRERGTWSVARKKRKRERVRREEKFVRNNKNKDE